MEFVTSISMKVTVSVEQEKQLASKETILRTCRQDNVVAFDIFHQGVLIGFVMLREYEKGGFFLWAFAIDRMYQNQGLGTRALNDLIRYMNLYHAMHTITTTYKLGNEHAKHVYEKIGFVETDIVDEPDCHEVDMSFKP